MNTIPGTVCCLLCRGMVIYKNGDKSRFKAHMNNEHGAFFNIDYLLASCLLEEDQIDAVAKSGKFIANPMLEENDSAHGGTASDLIVKVEKTELAAMASKKVKMGGGEVEGIRQISSSVPKIVSCSSLNELDLDCFPMLEENNSADRGTASELIGNVEKTELAAKVPKIVSTGSLLNESVLDCGKIMKKIPSRELNSIVPKKLKVEHDPPEACLKCNYCLRSFTCASSLVSHLGNHFPPDQLKLVCPIPCCEFSNTKEKLIRHIRAKHSGEKLFTCKFCPKTFATMAAKSSHENKHSRGDIWAQCPRYCSKFYRVAVGYCKNCEKK